MKNLRPLIKMHGGKYYLAEYIISHFPPDYTSMYYIEPCCGGANVLLRKKQSVYEMINDVDEDIVNLLSIVRSNANEFINEVSNISYSKETFEEAVEKQSFSSNMDHAVNEFVLRRMSRGGLRNAFAWSNRQRGGLPGDENAWNTLIEMIPAISQRLQRVTITNRNILKDNFFDDLNNEKFLIYLDPPYHPETRSVTNVYEHEMTIDEHIQLGNILNQLKAKILISGYNHPDYEKLYLNWNKYEKIIANHSSQKKTKEYKKECLWTNF